MGSGWWSKYRRRQGPGGIDPGVVGTLSWIDSRFKSAFGKSYISGFARCKSGTSTSDPLLRYCNFYEPEICLSMTPVPGRNFLRHRDWTTDAFCLLMDFEYGVHVRKEHLGFKFTEGRPLLIFDFGVSTNSFETEEIFESYRPSTVQFPDCSAYHSLSA